MAVDEILAAVRAVPAYAAVPAVLFSALPEEEGQRRGAQCGGGGDDRAPLGRSRGAAASLPGTSGVDDTRERSYRLSDENRSFEQCK
jgi:hypothetical protein